MDGTTPITEDTIDSVDSPGELCGARVSTNAEFQTAIDSCPESRLCSIVLTDDMIITTTLNMEQKHIHVSSDKTDGTHAILGMIADLAPLR